MDDSMKNVHFAVCSDPQWGHKHAPGTQSNTSGVQTLHVGLNTMRITKDRVISHYWKIM